MGACKLQFIGSLATKAVEILANEFPDSGTACSVHYPTKLKNSAMRWRICATAHAGKLAPCRAQRGSVAHRQAQAAQPVRRQAQPDGRPTQPIRDPAQPTRGQAQPVWRQAQPIGRPQAGAAHVEQPEQEPLAEAELQQLQPVRQRCAGLGNCPGASRRPGLQVALAWPHLLPSRSQHCGPCATMHKHASPGAV